MPLTTVQCFGVGKDSDGIPSTLQCNLPVRLIKPNPELDRKEINAVHFQAASDVVCQNGFVGPTNTKSVQIVEMPVSKKLDKKGGKTVFEVVAAQKAGLPQALPVTPSSIPPPSQNPSAPSSTVTEQQAGPKSFSPIDTVKDFPLVNPKRKKSKKGPVPFDPYSSDEADYGDMPAGFLTSSSSSVSSDSN